MMWGAPEKQSVTNERWPFWDIAELGSRCLLNGVFRKMILLRSIVVAISLMALTCPTNSQTIIDRFDGSTTSNWQRLTFLDIGSATSSLVNGNLTFSTLGLASENQVFLSNSTISLNNSKDWSVEVGMCNTTSVQLQVYVGNSDFSDYFGVTLGGYFGVNNQKWGAEFPGNEWWGSGIRNDATQQGAIKIEYSYLNRTYSLYYSNQGLDPISNNYTWNISNSRSASEQAEMQLILGMNTGNIAVTEGQLFFDNLRVIPEPSALSLLAVGLGGFAVIRRRRP